MTGVLLHADLRSSKMAEVDITDVPHPTGIPASTLHYDAVQQYFATHPSSPIPQQQIGGTITRFHAVQRHVGPAGAGRLLQRDEQARIHRINPALVAGLHGVFLLRSAPRAESTGRWGRSAPPPADHLRSREEHGCEERTRRPAADHLRSRGEHSDGPSSATVSIGSPPLARRARLPPRRGAPIPRTTSARAESTPHELLGLRSLMDHLRSRGEHTQWQAAESGTFGSPPLARRAGGVGERRW